MQLFRRFIPSFVKIDPPLTDLPKKGSGVHSWNFECHISFKHLKDCITSAPVLVKHFRKTFLRNIDASQVELGIALTQLDENWRDRVQAYLSKDLSPPERNCTENDRELLALISFLERFRCCVEGCDLEIIIMDQQILRHFVLKKEVNRGKQDGLRC